MAGTTHIWADLPKESEKIVEEDIKTTVEELDALKARQAFLQRKLESLLRTKETNAQKRRDEARAIFLAAEIELNKMTAEHKAVRRNAGIDDGLDNVAISSPQDDEEDAPVIVEVPHSLDRSPQMYSPGVAVPCEPMPEPAHGIMEKLDDPIIPKKHKKDKKKSLISRPYAEEPAPEESYLAEEDVESIGRGSWVTTGFPPSERDKRGLGLGAIREWDNDRYTEHSYRSGSRRRDDSRFYGQEIDQDDGRSERRYDQYQYPQPSSRNSDDQTDLVSIIRSEVPESERRYPYEERDRESRRQYSERGRSNYGRSERSHRDRSIRQDYPASVSTKSQSRSYDRDRRPPYPSSSSHGPDTPSMDSRPTLPHIRPPPSAMPAAVNPFDVDAPRDAVLSSRFQHVHYCCIYTPASQDETQGCARSGAPSRTAKEAHGRGNVQDGQAVP